MKWLLLMAMLSMPIEQPKPLPKLPPHPIVRFLNRDIWKIYNLSKQCMYTEGMPGSQFCANAKISPQQTVILIFIWTF